MQVRVLVTPVTEMQVIAAAVAPIGDVHRLVQVLDQVDEEAQRLAAAGPRGVGVGQDLPGIRRSC